MAAGAEWVLITGFPRQQARQLLQCILDDEPATQVTLVVLSKLLPHAAQVIDGFSNDQRARIEVLEGDAAAIDLGLSGREYRDLASRLTRIHHLAHVSYVGVDKAAAEYTNVRGALEIVELASNCEQLACVVHHSTAHVSGDRTGIVYEDELDEGQSFHNPVQATRMQAEKVMRRAMPRLPIAVVRPTMLVGHSNTGEAERFDGPYLLVMLVLGLPGDMAVPLPTPADNPLNIVPVDYVARAAHALGRLPKAAGRTFHLASPELLTAQQVFDLIARAGGRRTSRGFIPTQLTNALLRTPGIDRVFSEPRAFLRQLTSSASYDTRNTDAALADIDLQCPPLASYVDTWVKAVQDHLRRPAQIPAAAAASVAPDADPS